MNFTTMSTTITQVVEERRRRVVEKAARRTTNPAVLRAIIRNLEVTLAIWTEMRAQADDYDALALDGRIGTTRAALAERLRQLAEAVA